MLSRYPHSYAALPKLPKNSSLCCCPRNTKFSPNSHLISSIAHSKQSISRHFTFSKYVNLIFPPTYVHQKDERVLPEKLTSAESSVSLYKTEVAWLNDRHFTVCILPLFLFLSSSFKSIRRCADMILFSTNIRRIIIIIITIIIIIIIFH